MEKRFLLSFFLFFFVLNALFPAQSDDLGFGVGGLNAAKHSYFHWNGRLGELLRVGFVAALAHTPWWAFINAAFGTAFFYLLFVVFFNRTPRFCRADAAFLALFLLWFLATKGFGAVFFWAAGSTNYLWSFVLMLLWFLPYRTLMLLNNHASSNPPRF